MPKKVGATVAHRLSQIAGGADERFQTAVRRPKYEEALKDLGFAAGVDGGVSPISHVRVMGPGSAGSESNGPYDWKKEDALYDWARHGGG